MKTAIVTCYDPQNFGNRLQNYAIHAVLSELGLECETLVPRQNQKTAFRKRRERAVRNLYDTNPLEAQTGSPGIVRQIRFEMFEQQHLPVRLLEGLAFTPAVAGDYRWIVTGGDGVWDPNRLANLGKMEHNLLSAARSAQRICMAPSAVEEELPEHMREVYHEQWIRFPWLNVRTAEDAALIRRVTGRDASVMEDPILLADPACWQAVMEPLPGFEEEQPYCLAWFTDREAMPENPEALALRLMPEGPEKVYCLGCEEQMPLCTAGPGQLLYLMQRAAMVMTDSYYGAVFAMILGKPFAFCGRGGAEEAPVRRMLQLRNAPCGTEEDCLWVSGPVLPTGESLARKKESLDLLREMFRLERQGTGKEEVSP